MEDWLSYRAELMKVFSGIEQVNPDTMRGLQILSEAVPAGGSLGPKIRELIALAVAVTTRCDGCIAFHSNLAQKAGATKEELAEALGVAVALNAGAALVYSARVMHAFESAQGS